MKLVSSLMEGDEAPTREFLAKDYAEQPVSIQQFIEDPRYLGKSLTKPDGTSRVYPYWREALTRVFPSNAVEVIFTGPIGSGKSTMIEIALAYIAHETICLKDPFDFYGLVRAQPMVLVFFSLSKELSQVGLFQGFMSLLLNSPWFCDRGTRVGIKTPVLTFPQKALEYSLGSPKVPGYGIVGKNVLAGGLDEISEITTAKELEARSRGDLAQMQALRIYQQFVRRMESRFLQRGVLPGKLFLASSKQDEVAFLEQYVESQKGSPTVMVFDDPLWEIQPPERFSGETFLVAVGDRFKTSRTVSEEEDADELEAQGYEVIEVPSEFRRAFELDVDGALRDIAGISTFSTRRAKLIPRAEFIERCVSEELTHPFTDEVIYLAEDDEIGVEDYFQMGERFKTSRGRFIHVDLGLTGDACGVAMCHVSGEREVERLQPDGTTVEMRDRIVTYDFLVRVSNVEGSEIPFWKIRRFILYLRKQGVPIRKVTFDGWQSVDGRQLLRRAGFESETLSVDRNDEPYVSLRSAIYEGRVVYYRYEPFLSEVGALEHHRRKRKVDHPDGGSKDVADAAAGALFSATGDATPPPEPTKTLGVLEQLVQHQSETPSLQKLLGEV